MDGIGRQLGDTQMSPSGHTANLSDLDSLLESRLHDAEEVNHTAFRPASEPYDEQRHLLYPVDAVDAVGASWALKLGFVRPHCKLCKLRCTAT